MRPYNQSKRPYSTVERLHLNKNWLLVGLFFSTIAGFLTLVRVSQRVSRANSKKYEFTAKYFPQILKVHMYITKKLALQANIFKISNVGIE